MSWNKLSLVLLGIAILLVLLGGPFYGMSMHSGIGSGMWGMMKSYGLGNYGWMPMMNGAASAYFLAGWFALGSFVSALVGAYRTGDGKQDVLFIGTVSAIAVVALFVPGGAWIAAGLYILALVLLWK